MTEEVYSIWLQSSTCSQNIFNFIEKYAKEENKDTFLPHVTLVSHISSEENGIKVLKKLSSQKK